MMMHRETITAPVYGTIPDAVEINKLWKGKSFVKQEMHKEK